MAGNETNSQNQYEFNDDFNHFFKLEKRVTLSQKKTLIGRLRQFSVGPEKNFWVLDSKKNKIYKYNRNGEFISSIGDFGQGPGEFIQAYDFFIGKESIYVVDPMARKVNVFTKDGDFKYFFMIEDGRTVQEGKNGEIVIAAPLIFRNSGSSACIHIYNKKGKRTKSFLPINKNAIRHNLISGGVFFDLDQEGNIYCVQEMEYKIHHYTINGQPIKTFSEIKPYYIPPPNGIIKKMYLRSALEKWLKSWTHIIGLNRLNNLLFVTLLYFEGSYEYRLDIYNKDGNLIKGDLATNYRLLYIDKNGNLYFLQETMNPDSFDSSYNILIYSVKNKKFMRSDKNE
jgi:hypothetical protein